MFFFVSMIFYDHLILACQIAIITSSLSISVGFAPFHVTKGYRTLGIPWDRIVPQGSPGFNLAKTCLGLLRCLLWDCSCAKVLLLVGMQMMSSSFKGSLEPKTGKEPPKAGNFRKTSIILIILPRFFHLVHLPNLNTIQYHPIPLFWNSVLATAVLRAQDCRIISLSLGATRSFELRRNWHLGSTKRRCAVLQVSFGVISYILYNILITLYAFLQYNLTSSIFGCGFSFAVWHVLEPSLDPRLHGKWGVAGVKNHKEHVWLNIVIQLFRVTHKAEMPTWIALPCCCVWGPILLTTTRFDCSWVMATCAPWRPIPCRIDPTVDSQFGVGLSSRSGS